MKIFEKVKLISERLKENETILEILGVDHIDSLITPAPTINATELNELDRAQHFITVSVYNVSNFTTHDEWVIKIGVATAITANVIDNFEKLSMLVDEVKKTISTEELILGFPEQVILTESEETLFSNDNKLWGYTMFFVSKTSG